jgi:membrane protein
MKSILDLLKETVNEWQEDKASRLAAALSYYTIFSLAPLVILSIAIVGLVYGQAAVEGRLFDRIAGIVGAEAAEMIQTMIANVSQPTEGVIATLIGFGILLWGATSLFGQLKDALNTIWNVRLKPGGGMSVFIRTRLLSFLMVLLIGFILLLTIVSSTALSVVSRFFGDLLPMANIIWYLVEFLVTLALLTLLFAIIFKVLPDVEIEWSEVWVGASATAVLFNIGRILIGIYMGMASVASPFGAAGSLVVLLLWIYYSAQIFFFGAEFTKVYARQRGARVMPSPGAFPLGKAARLEQGIPRTTDVETIDKSGGIPLGAYPTVRRVSEAEAPQQRKASLGYAIGFGVILALLGMIWRNMKRAF